MTVENLVIFQSPEHLFDHVGSVAEAHAGVFFEEKRVSHACVTGGHAAFKDHYGLGLPNLHLWLPRSGFPDFPKNDSQYR